MHSKEKSSVPGKINSSSCGLTSVLRRFSEETGSKYVFFNPDKKHVMFSFKDTNSCLSFYNKHHLNEKAYREATVIITDIPTAKSIFDEVSSPIFSPTQS